MALAARGGILVAECCAATRESANQLVRVTVQRPLF